MSSLLILAAMCLLGFALIGLAPVGVGRAVE
jgi:hypothetical protein